MYDWEDRLRIELIDGIEAAIGKVGDHYMSEEGRAIFPFYGDNTTRLMAQAAITVLQAIADTQDLLKEDGLLDF